MFAKVFLTTFHGSRFNGGRHVNRSTSSSSQTRLLHYFYNFPLHPNVHTIAARYRYHPLGWEFVKLANEKIQRHTFRFRQKAKDRARYSRVVVQLFPARYRSDSAAPDSSEACRYLPSLPALLLTQAIMAAERGNTPLSAITALLRLTNALLSGQWLAAAAWINTLLAASPTRFLLEPIQLTVWFLRS